MINDFLKEYYELCKKHNTELLVNTEYELEAKDITTGKVLAKDINVWQHSKKISYLDLDDNEIDLKMK